MYPSGIVHYESCLGIRKLPEPNKLEDISNDKVHKIGSGIFQQNNIN